MTGPVVVPAPAVPGWVRVWLWVLSLLLAATMIAGGIFIYLLWTDKHEMYLWNKQMHRWAAHYYYCDSAHKDDAKCAAWSDHISVPPPPPDQ
ncbi:MAG: hypothetical protein ACJ793_10940 [Gemmatimonadaceae bacterium]